jgi:hypothetical protein
VPRKNNGKASLELSDQEMEYLQQIHVASALKQLTEMPGWEHFTKTVADMIARLEDQHLNFALNASRDAYWASGIRLSATREFAKILTEQIAQKVDILNQPLRPPKPIDPDELDGDDNGRKRNAALQIAQAGMGTEDQGTYQG